MGHIIKPYTFTSQTKILSAQVNTDFDALYTQSNAHDDQITTLTADNTQYVKATGVSATDDVNLQSAITNAATNKRSLVLLGQFVTSVSMNVPSNSNISFAAGAKITNSSDNSIFTHTSDSVNANITIQNANIEGNHTGTGQYAIYFSGVTNVIIDKCTINYTARGVRLTNCPNFSITRNVMNFNGFTASSADQACVLLETGSYGRVESNQIYDGTGIGVHLLGANDSFIAFNTIWRCTSNGIRGDGGIHYRNIVTKNNVQYCGNAGNLTGADAGINFHGLTDGEITHNICSNNYFYGIDVTGTQGGASAIRVKGLTIEGNTITNNGDVGLIVFDSKYVNVGSNLFKANKINLKVDGVSSYVKIVNNQFFDTTSAANNVHINAGNHIEFDGNTCGEVDSTATAILELRVESAVTNVVLGWNDFSLALKTLGSVFLGNLANISFKNPRIFVSDEITLSAAAYNSPIPLIPPSGTVSNKSLMYRAYAVYTEAASSDAGVVFGIGVAGQTNTYFGTATSIASAVKGATQSITMLNNGQLTATENKPFFYCAGGKTGLGKIKIVVEYMPSVPVYL